MAGKDVDCCQGWGSTLMEDGVHSPSCILQLFSWRRPAGRNILIYCMTFMLCALLIKPFSFTWRNNEHLQYYAQILAFWMSSTMAWISCSWPWLLGAVWRVVTLIGEDTKSWTRPSCCRKSIPTITGLISESTTTSGYSTFSCPTCNTTLTCPTTGILTCRRNQL